MAQSMAYNSTVHSTANCVAHGMTRVVAQNMTPSMAPGVPLESTNALGRKLLGHRCPAYYAEKSNFSRLLFQPSAETRVVQSQLNVRASILECLTSWYSSSHAIDSSCAVESCWCPNCPCRPQGGAQFSFGPQPQQRGQGGPWGGGGVKQIFSLAFLNPVSF